MYKNIYMNNFKDFVDYQTSQSFIIGFSFFSQRYSSQMTISYACSMFLWHKVWTKTRMTQWKASQPVLNGHIIVSYRFVALKTNAKRSKYKKNEKKNQSSDIRFRTCTFLYCNSNWLCSQYEIQIEIKMCQIEKNVGTFMLGAQWRYGYVHTRCKKVLLKKVLSFIQSITFQSKEKRNHKHYLFPYVI